MIESASLETLLRDSLKPNHLPEVELLLSYLDRPENQNTPPLFLSLGQSAYNFPSQLVKLLGKSPAMVHGYGLSMYGYPPLRRTLIEYIESEYYLPKAYQVKGLYELAVAQTGTRSYIFDYACWLKNNYTGNSTGRLFTFAPGWDYADIFKTHGFEIDYLELDDTAGFVPDVLKVKKRLQTSFDKGQKPVLALNAQHNPTGVNWDAELIRTLLVWCLHYDIPILFDDAYFSVCEPGVQPTAVQSILLDLLNDAEPNRPYAWLGVRSLGKQFCCNGWGIGLITAPPTLLDDLVNNYQTIHHYNINGAFQYALNEWLLSVDSNQFIQSYNARISANRQLFTSLMIKRLGYPENSIPKATCTPYQLFALPRNFENKGTSQYIASCITKTGTVFSDVWPLPHNDKIHLKKYDYLRCFLGVENTILEEAFERMEKADLHY